MGRNYRDHARELGHEPPEEPLVFLKPPSSLVPSGTPIVLPPGAGRVDYEGEIAFIVGRRSKDLSPDEAVANLSHVLPLNDVTARDLQRRDDQWTRAKGFDTFCPVGTPVPLEGIEVAGLRVETRVNGDLRQSGGVSEFIFPLGELLAWVTSVMTLMPGDILATGTPAGVGPVAAGDRVSVTIPGVGSVENPVTDTPSRDPNG